MGQVGDWRGKSGAVAHRKMGHMAYDNVVQCRMLRYLFNRIL